MIKWLTKKFSRSAILGVLETLRDIIDQLLEANENPKRHLGNEFPSTEELKDVPKYQPPLPEEKKITKVKQQAHNALKGLR